MHVSVTRVLRVLRLKVKVTGQVQTQCQRLSYLEGYQSISLSFATHLAGAVSDHSSCTTIIGGGTHLVQHHALQVLTKTFKFGSDLGSLKTDRNLEDVLYLCTHFGRF